MSIIDIGERGRVRLKGEAGAGGAKNAGPEERRAQRGAEATGPGPERAFPPQAWMALQRLAGNRAVVHHLGSLSQVQVPVAQREIGDDVEEGEEIKIWDPDAGKAGEVVVVTFVRLDGDEVLCHPPAEVSTKGSQAKKKANRGQPGRQAEAPPDQKPLRVLMARRTRRSREKSVLWASKRRKASAPVRPSSVTSWGCSKTNGQKHGLDVEPDARKVVDALKRQ